jgi:hypothetical protein
MNRNKKIIRLTESDLHNIIKESVKQVLREGKYVNNIPWEDSQKYKDGYQAFLDHEKEKEDLLNYDGESEEEFLKKLNNFKNGPSAKMSDKWKNGNLKHSERAIKRYNDDRNEKNLWWNRPESLKRFQAQRINDLGDKWKNDNLEGKRDWMAMAKDDWYDTPTERNTDREYYDRNYLDDDF